MQGTNALSAIRITILLEVLKQRLFRECGKCLVKVFPSLDGFVHGDLLDALLRVLASNDVWMVHVGQTIKLMVHQCRVEVAIVLDMQKFVWIKDLASIVNLHLQLDQFVGVHHPLAAVGEHGPFDHPASVGQVCSLLRARALAEQDGEAEED